MPVWVGKQRLRGPVRRQASAVTGADRSRTAESLGNMTQPAPRAAPFLRWAAVRVRAGSGQQVGVPAMTGLHREDDFASHMPVREAFVSRGHVVQQIVRRHINLEFTLVNEAGEFGEVGG